MKRQQYIPNQVRTLTPVALQAKATEVALGFRTACAKQAGSPELAVAERLLAAIKALPAYEAAVQAVADTGHGEMLPAAVIRKLGEQE